MRLRLLLICILLVLFTTSCAFLPSVTPGDAAEWFPGEKANVFTRWYNTNDQQADYVFDQVIRAIEANDSLALRELFATSTINTVGSFDEDIDALLDFYEGEMISHKQHGPGSHAIKDGTYQRKEVFASYDISTNFEEYRLAIRFCTVDSENPENLGIFSLYIIKAEDSNMDYAYWGNDVWNPGINIEGNEK